MKNYITLLFISAILGCTSTDEPTIISAEERIVKAKSDLIDELTKPSNGWILNYQPVSGAGIYYLLLKFNEDGMVRIQSDLKSDDRDFYDDVIPYRIDNRLTLELVLETYGVFHYLFEQRASTFEAEFEFLFVEAQQDNLIFASKTDLASETTILTFMPASSSAADLFSRQIYENWSSFEDNSPQFLGAFSAQHVVLTNQNISIFWNMDFLERNMEVTIAAVGSTVEEMSINNNFVEINHSTGYLISDGKLSLLIPFSFSLGGANYTINEIELINYDLSGAYMCPTSGAPSPIYTCVAEGIGPCSIFKSLFDYEGSFFLPFANNPYLVDVFFVVDSNGFSLSNSGSINEYFPNATTFAFNYGYISTASAPQPSYAVGLYVEDENGIIQSYLREFEMTTTIGNKVEVKLLDDYYFSSPPGPNDQQNLALITDEIFEEGVVFTSGVASNGLKVFRLFNPCNGYEVYLIQ